MHLHSQPQEINSIKFFPPGSDKLEWASDDHFRLSSSNQWDAASYLGTSVFVLRYGNYAASLFLASEGATPNRSSFYSQSLKNIETRDRDNEHVLLAPYNNETYLHTALNITFLSLFPLKN